MGNTRRDWLRQTGLAVAGLGLLPLDGLAIPTIIKTRENADEIIRLRSNENPYGPSPSARTAMMEAVNKSNRYGWQLASELITVIAKKNKLDDDNVLLGCGSTEILDIVVRYAAKTKGSLVMAATTFDYWTSIAEELGLEKKSIPLTSDKKHDLKAMLKAIQPDTKLVYICNPNNPTGTICDTNELIAFVNEASKKTLVLIDEAYIDFTNEPSLINLVVGNKNVIVARTFSKVYGLAGARVGYAVANSAIIADMSKMQSSNSGISVVSAYGALASLNDTDFVKETIALNEAAKNYTIQQLEHLGMKCIPSVTNFVYFSLINYKKDYFDLLSKNNILGTRIYEEEGKWTRITIGAMDEMKKFIKALE
ncbi:putative phenylalanine aminotransferase [compost metagenome]